MHCKAGCGHVHFSALKFIERSPAHYRQAADVAEKDTTTFLVGRVFHEMVLDNGGGFVLYEGSRRGKEWDAFKAEHSDVDIVTAVEHETANAMATAVKANTMAMTMLAGRHEVDLEWDYLGRRCKGTIDAINDGADPFITELKSTYMAKPSFFNHIARKLQYFAQLPWYANGARIAGVLKPDAPYPRLQIVAVENKPPYAVTTFALDASAIEYGEKCYRLWMEMLLNCEASNDWPAYGDGPHVLDVPEELELTIGGEPIYAE